VTDQQWKRALELYEAAVELPATAASALLESSTEEPAVVQKVNTLLQTPAALDVTFGSRSTARFAGCVIGRYDVIHLLGRGSTGEVYAGRDRELGRPVALKIMSEEYASMNSSARRFIREAQASSALNHPNIVTVHEVITWNSWPVIVMELVEGKPLRALCGEPMPVGTAVPIAAQMMRAIATAHANGIVHRDLKPENVVVRPDGYVKVLDFGLARRSFVEASSGTGGEGSSTAGLPVGTLRYMSPEQCRGEPATAASDVFAAGIVLYEMLAGCHPFHADSPLETAHAIARTQPRPLKQRNPDLSSTLQMLVARMLEKDSGARPSSQEVADALILSEDRATPALGRRRWPSLSFAVLLAVLAVAAGSFWFVKNSVRTKKPDSVQEPDLQILPLASLLGLERMPDISPDGSRVAFEFSDESSPISHVYLKDRSTARLTQLTDAAWPDNQPVFSPDGSKLAFLRRQNRQTYVMLMPSTGGIERKLAEISDTGIYGRVISWDGFGTNVIVSEGLGSTRAQAALFAISVDSGAKRQITFPSPGELDCMPIVSQDGRSLGFARVNDRSIGSIWRLPIVSGLPIADENQKRLLTQTTEPMVCWNWTPDGRDLVICRVNAGRTLLWRYPLLSGSPSRVGGLDEEVTQTTVTRWANHILYAGEPPQNISIWQYPVPPATGTPKRLIASAKMDVDARYSPDGKNIAFSSSRAGEGQTDLWICANDGSNQHQLTAGEDQLPHAIGSPSWSPDGRWIAYDANFHEPKTGIYILDVLGGKPRRLTTPDAAGAVPSWSRDGRWIYYSSDREGQNIWKVSPAGGAPVQVTHDLGFESFESPDGKFLYFSGHGFQSRGIWRMPLPDGKPEPVTGLEGVTERNWEGSSKGIYFMLPLKPPALELYNFSTRQVTQIRRVLTPLPGVYHGLAISPDGLNMLYLQVDPGRSNIMIVSNFQ
jgi:serine/threonine protein kinase